MQTCYFKANRDCSCINELLHCIYCASSMNVRMYICKYAHMNVLHVRTYVQCTPVHPSHNSSGLDVGTSSVVGDALNREGGTTGHTTSPCSTYVRSSLHTCVTYVHVVHCPQNKFTFADEQRLDAPVTWLGCKSNVDCL